MSATHTHPIGGLASPANLLTIGRIALSPLLFYLILGAEDTLGTSWAVFTLGVVFGLSDFLDGRVARRDGTVSRSGAFLDPLADKIVVLGAAICFVVVGRYWWVPVAIMTVREVAVSALRVNFARQGMSVPATLLAKWKTVIQAVALGVAALPPLEDHRVAVVTVLWVAVAVTVYTGWQYFRDGAHLTSPSGG